MNDFVDVEFFRPNIIETVVKPSDSLTLFNFQEEKINIYLQKHKRMVSKDVEKLLRIKESRTRELLKQMVDKGFIVRLGRGRSTCYVLGKS